MAAARRQIVDRLPLALCHYSSGDSAALRSGQLPRAVRIFISQLPVTERALAQSRENDLIDYILTDVEDEVGRTVDLLDLCRLLPSPTLDELSNCFPWALGLKRNPEWKRMRIADYLRSMLALGVELPSSAIKALGTEGESVFKFNEVYYATSRRRLELSWRDFRMQQELGRRFVCLIDDEESVAAEAFDYGVIAHGRALREVASDRDLHGAVALTMIGRRLGSELTALMESAHTQRPTDGYRPIAWHNVFWELVSEYEALQPPIEIHDPYCERDQDLADHLKSNFPEVRGVSRPSILRRRRRLQEQCDNRIRNCLLEQLA